MQATGHLVGVLVELAARVQPGQHDRAGGNVRPWMDVGRNATPVVAHRDRAVAVKDQLAARSESGLRLVHRVVDDLECHVMQAGAIVGVADIHAGPSPDGVQAAQH